MRNDFNSDSYKSLELFRYYLNRDLQKIDSSIKEGHDDLFGYFIASLIDIAIVTLFNDDLAEMDMKIEEMTDDVDYDEYMKELDELEEKEAKERLAKMPEAPKTTRLVKEVEMKEKERVAELEYIVCSRRAKRNEMDD